MGADRRFSAFFFPSLVAVALLAALLLGRDSFYLVAISIGLAALFVTAYQSIRAKDWSLDYIAFLAMLLAVVSGELLAGGVIAFMYVGGRSLEAYASGRAQASLAALLARLPKTAQVKMEDGQVVAMPLGTVPIGAVIVVRSGELVPLDGCLRSAQGVLNLANLTGEAIPETLAQGAIIKSGSINAGAAIELSVSGVLATSTYAKIITLVERAEKEKAPFVRLAERANIPFTVLTLLIAGGVYLLTGDVTRLLAVLVIATPCPLIIAAPVAFIGGLSRAAGKNLIIKTPGALETLARVTTIFFDKTGTLTLGEPKLEQVQLLARGITEHDALALAAALEFHSIHPLARALVAEARARGLTPDPALEVTETVGTGIHGLVRGESVSLGKAPEEHAQENGISLLLQKAGRPIASFHFADVLKDNAKELVCGLSERGYRIVVVTGDRKENAEAVFGGFPLTLYAGCTPEDKYRLVDEARRKNEIVAMVGDGLNDAPALARADVGIVFSGTENSASIEAADVAVLGHDVLLIRTLFGIAHRSVRIARESVYAGIGLSGIGMLFAAFGFIVPVEGAVLQEGIDVAVILNALRAAFTEKNPHA